MIYKPLINKENFLGAELRLTPVELLIVKDSLRQYTKNEYINHVDRIRAQLVLKDMELAEDTLIKLR